MFLLCNFYQFLQVKHSFSLKPLLFKKMDRLMDGQIIWVGLGNYCFSRLLITLYFLRLPSLTSDRKGFLIGEIISICSMPQSTYILLITHFLLFLQ
jgi:hypothetical protein